MGCIRTQRCIALAQGKNYVTTECRRDVRSMDSVISIVHEDQKVSQGALTHMLRTLQSMVARHLLQSIESTVKKNLTLGEKVPRHMNQARS